MSDPPTLPDAVVDAYLARIGYAGPRRPDATTLVALQHAHLDHVPFENLDIHLGVPIALDVDAFVAKIVDRRRGGFCYELNGAFGALLRALGFPVDHLEARVFEDGQPGIPYDHLVLRVTAGAPYLVDVGFGAAFRSPLRLEPGIEQRDPAGVFRIDPVDDATVDLVADGEPMYRVSLTPRELGDFAPGCRHNQTSPDSHFTQGTVCSLPTADGGRITVRNRTLVTTQADGSRDEHDLDEDQLREVPRSRFGICLDHPPTGPRALG